ncbi:MAG: peptide chain release factor N(5)-glutamine methyltransferase [Actinomycetota bacterium]|nr:peptide chain release factor N(5)-glutamine methyltransferase [Actinomycetota bacterium]
MTTDPQMLGETLKVAEAKLEAAGCDTPRGDAQWIAAYVLGGNRTSVLAHPERVLTPDERKQVESLITRRAGREPLAYVLGTVVFRGLELEIGPGCLVPRPETEVTAERAIFRARALGRRATVVDVGTGCGPIALSVAAEVPDARVFATEISGAARGWCLRNLARTGLRVTLLPGDLFDPLHPALGGAVDIIVSNPPYIADDDIALLPDEVRKFEPRDALKGGPDGLDVVMRLLEEVPRWLAVGGWLVVEVGADQAEKVGKLLEMVGYTEATVTHDLAGRPRVVEGRWMGV